MEENPHVPVGMGNERVIRMNNTRVTTDILSMGDRLKLESTVY